MWSLNFKTCACFFWQHLPFVLTNELWASKFHFEMRTRQAFFLSAASFTHKPKSWSFPMLNNAQNEINSKLSWMHNKRVKYHNTKLSINFFMPRLITVSFRHGCSMKSLFMAFRLKMLSDCEWARTRKQKVEPPSRRFFFTLMQSKISFFSIYLNSMANELKAISVEGVRPVVNFLAF